MSGQEGAGQNAQGGCGSHHGACVPPTRALPAAVELWGSTRWQVAAWVRLFRS